MPTKPSAKAATKLVPYIGSLERDRRVASAKIYGELTRISAGLLIAVIALMTFLLSVGLSHPKLVIEITLYTSLAALSLSLIAHLVAIRCDLAHLSSVAADEAGAAETAPKRKVLAANREKAAQALRKVRVAQQVLFLLSVIAVIAFAVAGSQLFFTAPVTSAVTTSS